MREKPEFIKENDFGANVKVITASDGCTIMRLEDKTGEGFMTVYEVLDGVFVMFNDFHMSEGISQFQPRKHKYFCIDHCREGRIEHTNSKGKKYFRQAGDVQMDTRSHHKGDFYMPLHHYHGVSIGFQADIAQKSLEQYFPMVYTDICALSEKFCPNSRELVFHCPEQLELLLRHFYQYPQRRQNEYFALKIMELLLYLDLLDMNEIKDERPYFQMQQVDKIKAIHELITTECDKNHTLAELSKRYQISVGVMRRCFEGIYGVPMHRYLNQYRMNVAASMLKQSDMKIADIASHVGYDNPAKFSASFRGVMGVSPAEYRNNR